MNRSRTSQEKKYNWPFKNVKYIQITHNKINVN